MAPALSSHPFRLVTGSPHSRAETRITRPSVTVHAKQNVFGFGKQKSEPEGETVSENSNKQKPFFFDYVNDAKSLIPVVKTSSTSLFAGFWRKDPNTVFVSGASGQAGARIVQMLLRQGFAVRAGVPDLESAQELARIAVTYKLISPDESKRLNAVESTFSEPESIAKAIGPATKAVVTIGPAEDGPTSAVTTDDALRLILAAQLAGVSHVAVIYDSLSESAQSTNNVIDGITSFFSNLFSKSNTLTLAEFLDKLVETDVSYTLIKAALAEDYGEETSYGVVVSKEGSLPAGGTPNEYKVAKSQIAKLVADVFSNTAVAENKVVEVSTSPSAGSKSVSELFSGIPEDGRRKAYQEATAKAKAEEEITLEKAREAAEAAKKLEKQEVAPASLAKEAQAKVQAAGFTMDNLLSKAKDFGDGGVGKDFSWEKLSLQFATATSSKGDEESKTQVATVRGQAKARNLPPQKAVVKQSAPKPRPKQPVSKPKAKEPAPKREVNNVFGGLFKQETIYMDDD